MNTTLNKIIKELNTPGPWIAEHSGTGDASVIAKPGWKNKDGTEYNPVLIKRIDWPTARLIAAAPNLLDACTVAKARILELQKGHDRNYSYQSLNIIDNAIKLAKCGENERRT